MAILGGFRARRKSAEQETPGSHPQRLNWEKGVTAMAKDVFFKVKSLHPDALAILGWVAFVACVIAGPRTWIKLVLLSIARVLP
jgi:hypothetical protein